MGVLLGGAEALGMGLESSSAICAMRPCTLSSCSSLSPAAVKIGLVGGTPLTIMEFNESITPITSTPCALSPCAICCKLALSAALIVSSDAANCFNGALKSLFTS